MNIIKDLEQYMFSSKNMMKYNQTIMHIIPNIKKMVYIKQPELELKQYELKQYELKQPELKQPEPELKQSEPEPITIKTPPEPIKLLVKEQVKPFTPNKSDISFTPAHKDKLFWCFYVLLNSFSEYEFNKTGYYAVEKAFKIKTVEKLRGMKSEIKGLKLKINDVEDELVNKEQITLKGLQVLCLVYKVSITYIYGRKYCEFLYGDNIKGIISQHKQYKGTHSLLYDVDESSIKQTYWYIENPQKPVNAPTAYTLKELQDICIKLEIPITCAVGTCAVGTYAVGKNKTKKELYEDILTSL